MKVMMTGTPTVADIVAEIAQLEADTCAADDLIIRYEDKLDASAIVDDLRVDLDELGDQIEATEARLAQAEITSLDDVAALLTVAAHRLRVSNP